MIEERCEKAVESGQEVRIRHIVLGDIMRRDLLIAKRSSSQYEWLSAEPRVMAAVTFRVRVLTWWRTPMARYT